MAVLTSSDLYLLTLTAWNTLAGCRWGGMFVFKCSRQTPLLRNAYHYTDNVLTGDCFSKGNMEKMDSQDEL